VSLLKKLFGGAQSAPASDASGLQTCVRDAERHVAAGRLDDAFKVAQRGLKTFPSAERLRKVVQFIQREKALAQLSRLKEKLEADRSPNSYSELVELYLELGKSDAALETVQAFVADHPDLPDAHAEAGHVQIKRYLAENFARDGWSAIESLEKAAELAPDYTQAHFRLAVLYFSIGAMGACTASIDKLLDLVPDEALTEFRNEVAARFEEDEDIEWLLDDIEEKHCLANDPGLFPGASVYGLESHGGTIDPELFAAAAAGIGRRLKVQQLAAVAPNGAALAVAGEDQDQFVGLAARLDNASSRIGRRMNFGTMTRFMVEGKFGRVVVLPAGNCAAAARVPRSVATDRVAEGLELIVTASRANSGEEQ